MFTCRACFRRALSTLFEQALPPKTYCPPTWRVRKYATAVTAVKTKELPDDGDGSSTTVAKSKEWAARKQLRYMQDPYHIASYVTKVLSADRFEEAALITRLASKDKNVTVSWNELIKYQLKHNRLRAALKLYNEMKKRAQLPNSHTYTIIFKGCADSSHPTIALAEAIKIYNKMQNLERLKPNTIHLNAVLKVCARAGDLDSLFAVLEGANTSTHALDNQSYTTILNALRMQIDKQQHRGISESEVRELIKRTIGRAKSIWEEVISRWRSGQVVIDETLVCAMGRILLLGGYYDVDSIAALIEQTMNIPRDVPDPKAEKRESKPEDSNALAVYSTFAKGKAPGAYARPGNNTLSMILASLEKTGKTTHAIRYWGIITKHHDVTPDAENWYQLVRAFRRGKNSMRAVNYMRNMPRDMMAPKHFRAAMGTCLRDRLNPAAIAHATAILYLMKSKLNPADCQTMRLYLRVAYACKRHFEEEARAGKVEKARHGYGRQLQLALGRLIGPYRAVALKVGADKVGAVGRGEEGAAEWMRRAVERAELVALARKMIATIDRLVSEDLVEPKTAEHLKQSRNAMNTFVVAYFEKRKQLDPAFRSGKAEGEGEEDEFEKQDEKEDREDGFYDYDGSFFDESKDGGRARDKLAYKLAAQDDFSGLWNRL
ncbi:hypothetical protein DL766_007417 [Monosporascus sp. MC13-8B]|uniref:Pentacotripeptide-repeat region of PRORP domain-containing protein n=1 Tax=Monosporascus cannonballus TaxID=155416 RepID=A0ABY0GSL8_9PEZI|nr:hypothetical protein DL762_009699 [Monosporascus cannonballus]RYO80462.1 hypothetical protein DL763_008907 [Monosporascus cannonballus]RYP23910.1 hypothetical protein DL766_007417 [Monosporascus sp. MC13-8B]